MNLIFTTIIISFVIAFLLGCLLGFFKKIFHVHEDEKIIQIRKALPNGNCGGCGFAGCASFAEAVAAGKAPANGCTAGGATVAKAIAAILDEEIDAENYIAVLACQGSKDHAQQRGYYNGVKSCKAAALAINGTKMCQFGCIGLGDCVKACKFDAIEMRPDGIPYIDKEKCTGCTMCMKACPHHLLQKIPVSQKAPFVMCSSRSENKPALIKDCKTSCIKCKKCERDCEQGAITFENNLPVIDAKKCNQCRKCVEGCPRGVIQFL